MRRPCLTCGTSTSTGPRCPNCETAHHQRRNANPRRRSRYGGNWATHAKQTIAAHRHAHGDICPGWRRPPHPIHPADWTCDHDLGPLCRSCNSTKAGATETPRGRGR